MGEQGLGVPVDQPAQILAAQNGQAKLQRRNAEHFARNLDDRAALRLTLIDGRQKAQRALPSDGGGLDRLAAAHQRQQ